MYAVGDCLVTRDELVEKQSTGAIHDFNEALTGKKSTKLKFSRGFVNTDSLKKNLSFDGTGQPIKPVAIGIGAPLTIEIRQVYTGRYPRTNFFRKSTDMLVTSAMKGIQVYNGAPRAVNFLQSNVKKGATLRNVDPTQCGTPIIFYSPALTQINSTLKIEMAFDEFPSEFFEVLKKAFGTAAGIPVFAPASAYLVIAGEVINLVSAVGKACLDSTPEFEAVTELTFDRPGGMAMKADFRLLMDEQGLSEIGGTYGVNDEGKLVHNQTRQEYKGDNPYVVLCFDGRPRKEYTDFTPTAATADTLGKFLGGKNIGQASIETVLSAMKLYNDWEFRNTAIKYNDEYTTLKNASGDPDRLEELLKLREAALKNIGNEAIKPSFQNK
jgi:hypothetical protein